MIDLNDVRVFLTVVETGSFTAAGVALGLPTSTVSRKLARLEKSVGAKLLNRTTRSLGLTRAGRVFVEHTGDIHHRVAGALHALTDEQDRPSGTLRITMPPDDGGVLWGLLEGFLLDNPSVNLHLIHTLDNLDLADAGIDVALRGGTAPDSPLVVAYPLFQTRMLLAASPAYLARRGIPSRAEDLADHDGLCMDPWAPNAIRRVDGDFGPVRVDMRHRIRANRLETARRACLAGLGIAPLLELTCADDLANGRLVEVLKGALPPAAPFFALVPRSKERTAAVAALLRHLLAVAGTRRPKG